MISSSTAKNIATKNRFTALFEVCGVYLSGMLLGYLVFMLLGFELRNPIEILKTNPNADLLKLSKDLAIILVAQYAGVFALAFGIGWWRRKHPAKFYGLTLASRPLPYHLLAGLVLYAAAEFPGRALLVMHNFLSLGPGSEMQEWVNQLSRWDFSFWVFMAVGSILLIPIVEELFYRGYVQSRLSEDFPPIVSILMVAFFFAFSHSQYYLHPSAMNIGAMLALIFSAVLWGYAYHRTRSLWATFIAHILINIPSRGAADYIILALMLIVIAVYHRQILAHGRQLWEMISKLPTPAIASLWVAAFAIFAIAIAISMDLMLLVGIIFLLIALALEFSEKRSARVVQQQLSAN